VTVEIDKLDDSNHFYGNVRLVDNPQFDITIELLKEGLASFVEWSVCKGANLNELKAAEDSAKQKQLKIWKNSQPTQPETKKNVQDITGKVTEIVSSGAIRVLPQGSKKKDTILIRFSSIRTPRIVPENDTHNIQSLDEEDRKKKIRKI